MSRDRVVDVDLFAEMMVALKVENEESQQRGIYAGTPGRWASLIRRLEEL